uniref:Polymerase n=1 Tax=Chrysanthemum ophiovirus_indi TaxID=2983934 RepID=A0A9N6YJP7_9VIRU|nr:TPA_asm: polymerase [Chrysanthemum ophiovirus_indi]
MEWSSDKSDLETIYSSVESSHENTPETYVNPNNEKRMSIFTIAESEECEGDLNDLLEEEEILKKHDEMMKKIEKNQKLSSLMYKYKEQFIKLNKIQKKEKKMEPEKGKIDYEQMFLYTEHWDREYISYTYIDKPVLINKIDSPYRSLSENVVEFFMKSDKYPEKFGTRTRIDVLRFREFVKKISNEGRKIEPVSSQDAVVNLFNDMSNMKIESERSDLLFDLGIKLLEFETNRNSENFLNKKKIMKRKDLHMELDSETKTLMWLVNLLETINHKIKINYSVMSSEKNYSQLSLEHEQRRIETKVNSDGTSFTKVTIFPSTPKERIINIFLSKTITAIEDEKNNLLIIGDGNMTNYLMTLCDHSLTLNLIKALNDSAKRDLEALFITFVKDLVKENNPKRVNMAALFEATCLLLSDLKSSSAILPIIDNIVDSINEDASLTMRLFDICDISDAETCIKMSCLGKVLVYAEVSETKGLDKYVQRTNRNHEVKAESVLRLKQLMRMKVVTNYIKKFGSVPKLMNAPAILEQELTLMAAGGNYNTHIINDPVQYRFLRLGAMLEVGNEVNINSRVIDKACTKDEYDFSGNSVKELIYYITQNNLSELVADVKIDDLTREERDVRLTTRKDITLKSLKKSKIVRLVEKEKELKTEARFYGVASFKLKIYISIIMEMVKRAMKLIPGQMMTMTEDERRITMHKMSCILDEKDSYSIFLDYSGHNTSQRPENNLFILEEIADMYGFEDGSLERSQLTNLVYLFSDIEILFENIFSDFVVVSKHQKGAIEGWFGPLWGIQSQLMMEDMLSALNFSKYIGTTYSDDSCGVFIERDLTEEKLDEIIEFIQQYALKMGLLVKLSQTQVTNGRCSMLKCHYYRDTPVENNFKRMMAITPNAATLWGDEMEQLTIIDSGYTSSVLRSNEHKIQTILRNFRVLKVIHKEIIRFSHFLDVELDGRFLSNRNAYISYAKICLKKFEIAETIDVSQLPTEDDIVLGFFRFNNNNEQLMSAIMMMMYLPYAMYGCSCTSYVDAMISGYSISNIKRICYVESLITTDKMKKQLYDLVKFSDRAEAYIQESFPMTGGKFDTKTLLKDFLKKELINKIENRELREILLAGNEENEEQYKVELLDTFKYSFSSRIVSKFYECSVFQYISEIFSKIDNSTTLSFLLGKKKLNKMWNKAWKANHKPEYKFQNAITGLKEQYGFGSLIERRDLTEKHYTLRGKKIEIKLDFIKIEELPILGKLSHDRNFNLIMPVKRSGFVYSGKNQEHMRRCGPTRTNVNTTKFDRDLEIEGMFQNKLIFMAYDLVRYIKWIIMDCEKFGKISEESKSTLERIADLTLSTFSDTKYRDIEEHVVAPKGGRYFHRAVSAGFNPKTGDLTSNLETSKYEATGVNKVVERYGGVDNNMNVALIITVIKCTLAGIGAEQNEIKGLNLQEDVLRFSRDVTFQIENLKPSSSIKCLPEKVCIKEGDLSSILKKSKLYKSFSYYVSTDEDIKGKFIDHKSVVPTEVINRMSSFHSLHRYMEDQEIICPDIIPSETLKKIAPEVNDYATREQYFSEFYEYYKGLNIIENETPTRSVVRSILYQELFRSEMEGGANTWAYELTRRGYSLEYRMVLLKIFIVTTSLVYRLEENKVGQYTLTIMKDRTRQNAIINLRRFKSSDAHFHTKDKRISNLLLMAFPTSGYEFTELAEAVNNIYADNNGKKLSISQINRYYESDVKNYIDESRFKLERNFIEYTEFGISAEDLNSHKMFSSALKGFEMICAMNCKPASVSSPTKSDVFPSAISMLSFAKNNGFIKEGESIADLFAGRGDYHFAMNAMNIQHRSVSRNDGYNLINRLKGMTEVKQNIDMTDKVNYSEYLDHKVFLLDISHFTGKKEKLVEMLFDLVTQKKKIIIRLNSLIKIGIDDWENILHRREMRILIPSVQSPGYVYLMINGDIYDDAFKNKREKKSFSESILAEKMMVEMMKIKNESLFSENPIRVSDHTEESISDDTLVEMLLESDSSFKYIPPKLESKLKKRKNIDFELMVEYNISKSTFMKDILVENTFIDSIRSRLIKWRPYIEKTGNSSLKRVNDIRKFMRDNNLTTEDIQTIQVDKDFKYLSGLYILGFKELNKEEVLQLSSLMENSRYIDQTAYASWRIIRESSELLKNDKLYSSNEILKNITKSSQTRNEYKMIDRIFNIANLAVSSYKQRKVPEGLLILSGIKKKTLSELMKNKEKEKRYDCLNYKLIINRIRVLHKEFNITVTEDHNDRNKFVFNKLKEIKQWQGSKTDNKKFEKEVQELESFIKEFNNIEDYFNSLEGNELFSCLISSIKSEENQIFLSETLEEDSTEAKAMQGVMATLFGNPEENMRKNKEMGDQYLIEENVSPEDYIEEFDDY